MLYVCLEQNRQSKSPQSLNFLLSSPVTFVRRQSKNPKAYGYSKEEH